MSAHSAPLSSAQRGFTLLETLVVVFILGVVLAIAIPNYTSTVNSGRLTGTANDLLAAVKLARSEAIRRNQRVVMCPTADGAACGGTWSQGWLVFEDLNRDGNVSTGEEVINTGVPAPQTQILPSASVTGTQRVQFGADGFARTAAGGLLNATFAVCRPVSLPNENVRDVVLTSGSRVSVTRRAASATCAAPANP